MLKLMIWLSLVSALVSCAAVDDGSVQSSMTDDVARCSAQGGLLVRGLLGVHCSLPASDAKAACHSGRQCKGLCLASGQCSEYVTHFGCIDILEEGQPLTICID